MISRDDAVEAVLVSTSTNETKAKGRTRKVTFEIPSAGVNPFEGLGGARFWLVAVRIHDDETHAALPAPAVQIEAPKKKWEELSLAQQAGIRCREPHFHEFLRERYGYHWSLFDEQGDDPREVADAVIKLQCAISSKSELDTDDAAANGWKEIDDHYYKWQRGAW